IAHEQRVGVGRLIVDRNAHVAERADDAIDGFRINQVIGQVVVDLTVGQISTLLTQLNQYFQAVAARLLLLGRHLIARRHVFIGLAAFAAPLGQRLQLGDDLGIAGVIVVEVDAIVVGILGGSAGTA